MPQIAPFPWIDVVIILALVVLNGLFAMSELAIVSSRAARLEAMPVEPVTAAMRDRFRAVIADPLPHLPVPATRNPRAIFMPEMTAKQTKRSRV